jgi:hypothetical protein
MPRPNEPEITWTLPMDQANTILSVLAQQPFERVAELIVELRNQAQAQIQLYQQQHQPPGMTRQNEATAP